MLHPQIVLTIMSNNRLSCSKACKDRDETVLLLESICSSARVSNVIGSGPLLLSDIPESCLNSKTGVVLGIDEAGR